MKNFKKLVILGFYAFLLAIKPIDYNTLAYRQYTTATSISKVLDISRGGSDFGDSNYNYFLPNDFPRGNPREFGPDRDFNYRPKFPWGVNPHFSSGSGGSSGSRSSGNLLAPTGSSAPCCMPLPSGT